METLSRSWVLRRNCSLTPRQLCVVFTLLGAISLLVSLAWALSGVWMILPFGVLELAVLAVVFFVYARHAADRERIILAADKVSVEVFHGACVERLEIPRQWLRCVFDEGHRELVRLTGSRKEVRVGQFVGPTDRKRFVKEFKAALMVPSL